MKRSNFVLIAALALVLSTGCHRSPKGVTPISQPNGTMPAARTAPPIMPSTNPALNRGNQIGLEDPNSSRINPIDTTPPKITSSGIEGADISGRDNMIPDREAFSSQTIHFDYDRASVKSTDRSKVEAVAAYLKNQPTQKVEVEGHCDERGTEEYNRALGERRALAAREALVSMGIGADRIFTTSFGEDRPADPAHDEQAWQKNRRDEFILLKPRQ
jgi:peptidoglycan-associated lipoprotein